MSLRAPNAPAGTTWRRPAPSAFDLDGRGVLDGADLHRLMEQEPLVAERIHAVVRERIGADIVSRKGDIVTEEIEQAREQSWP